MGLLVVVITLVLGLPAAYALARLDRPWSGPMAIAIFFVYLIPPSLLFLSFSRLLNGCRVIAHDLSKDFSTGRQIGEHLGISRARLAKAARLASAVPRSSASFTP